MTEQQRREQIMKARQQARPAVPALTNAEAQKIVSETNSLNQEQIIAIAMLGKMVQNDVNTIKKAGMGDIKVTDVDMSKVMPSGIAKAIGVSLPQSPAPNNLMMPQHAVAPVAPTIPIIPAPTVQQQPVVIEQNNNNRYVETDLQLELDFDKKARYIEVVESINALEKRIENINNKLDQLIELNKKKLTLSPNENGT